MAPAAMSWAYCPLAVALGLGRRLARGFRPAIGGDFVRIESHREMQVVARLDEALGEAGRELLAVDRRGLDPFVQFGGDGGDTVREDVVLLQRRPEVGDHLLLRLAVQGACENRRRSQGGEGEQRNKKARQHRRSISTIYCTICCRLFSRQARRGSSSASHGDWRA
jgi:hypothetical protein